ncbi:hypothetical protein CSA56_13255 [candidate division KSB3 bacterium]|uniref:Uncharacterized protein n=1 Tax=candidate division KSB3 bacterium TaxID=2044937 RepID=A0A2G6KBH9_9BACT|nr:MAG: hypothetical protein CSA56_13255 [candidate division KSB3 bacterium]
MNISKTNQTSISINGASSNFTSSIPTINIIFPWRQPRSEKIFIDRSGDFETKEWSVATCQYKPVYSKTMTMSHIMRRGA